MKTLFRFCFAALLAGMLNAPASAGNVPSQFFGGVNTISDDSGDYLINVTGGVATGGRVPGGDSTLDFGDFLVAAFRINTIDDTNPLTPTRFFGTGGNDEFTGIAVIKVLEKTPIFGGALGYTYAFGALSAADRATLATVSPLVGGIVGAWAPGTTIAFFSDPTPNFTRVTAFGADDLDPGLLTEDVLAASTAGDGTKILEVGFSGTPGSKEFWTAFTRTDDISVIGALPFPSSGGTFDLGQNVTANFTPLSFLPVPVFNPTPTGPYAAGGGTAQFGASGSLFGKEPTSPYDSYDSFEGTFHATPEPMSMTLFGIGLVGLVGLGYRRRKNTKLAV